MNGEETIRETGRQEHGFDESKLPPHSDRTEPRECPACGVAVPADLDACRVCGFRLEKSPRSMAAAMLGFQPSTSGKALGSLLLGCFSFLLLPGLAAVVLGHAALKQIRKSRGKLRGRGLARAGLFLGYAGIGAAPLLAMFLGVPAWHDARSGEQRSALHRLEILSIALQTYAATYGKGFPERLAQLGPAPDGAPLDAAASGFIEASLASGKAGGYTFAYAVTGRDLDGLPIAYSIHADPVGTDALRQPHYFTDQTQVIRVESNRVATNDSPPAPGGSELSRVAANP